MFTLCMSRGHPPLQDTSDIQQQNNTMNKQVKGGYLLRYKRGFFCKNWSEEWVVLYEDSTLAWYADKGLSRPRGHVRISESPELLAVGEWTRQVPRRPRFPRTCHIGQLLAIGSRAFHEVHWLMAQSPAEINDWMTAISNTLPPPPHLPLEDKRLSLSPLQIQDVHNNRALIPNGHAVSVRNGNCIRQDNELGTTTTISTTNSNNKNKINQNKGSMLQAFENDHTVLSGVVIDWGHGWGWAQVSCADQTACAAQTACAHEAAISSAVYCHTAEDYNLGGYDEVDWSAFGDFSF